MKPDPQAAPMQAWLLLANAGRTLTRTPSVWSVVLLVGLLALAQGRNPETGSRNASAGPVLPAAFMHAAGGRIDGTLARNVMQNAPIIEGTPGHLVVDTTLRISPDLVREIARAPYVRDLSNEMERIVEEFKVALGALDANVDDVGYAGIGLGEGYIGVNINRRLYSVDGRNSILVNPYRIAEEIEAWVSTGLTPTDAPREFSGRALVGGGGRGGSGGRRVQRKGGHGRPTALRERLPASLWRPRSSVGAGGPLGGLRNAQPRRPSIQIRQT